VEPEQRAASIQRLVSRLEGRPCVWVAPPLWEGANDALVHVIARSCAPCVFMSSREIERSLARTKDNIHPSMEARKEWARHVIDWLARRRRPAPGRPWRLAGGDGE
jgi:hypothetical protein